MTRKLNLKPKETAHHCASQDVNNNEISSKRHALVRNWATTAFISKSPVKAVVRRSQNSRKTVFKNIKSLLKLASSTPNNRVVKAYFDSSLSPIIFNKSQFNDNKIPIEQNGTEKISAAVIPNEEILEQRHISQMDVSGIGMTKTTTTVKDMHVDNDDNSRSDSEMVAENKMNSTQIYHKTIGSISKITRASGSISSDPSIVQKQNSISNEAPVDSNSERMESTPNALPVTNENQIEFEIPNLRKQSQSHNMKEIYSQNCNILPATRSETYLQKKGKALISRENISQENIRKEKPQINITRKIVPCYKESGTNSSKQINGNLNISTATDRTSRAKRKPFPKSNHPIKKEYYNPFNRNDDVRKYK